MTVPGKILVVVNLVLSVAVGALIVMTYVSSTNWYQAYTDLKSQVSAADNNSKAFRDEIDQTRALVAKANADLAQRDQALATLQQRNKALDDTITKNRENADKTITDLRANLTANQEQIKSRQQEVKYLTELVIVRDTKVRQMEKDVQDNHNRAVAAEIARNSEHQRNNNLLTQVETLSRDLQKAKLANVPAVLTSGKNGKTNPPAEDVEGLITAIDAQSGLITLSIGSDDGVGKGNTLEVYRLTPEPLYLGTLEVLATRPHEAVAKTASKVRGTMQRGDRVSNNIFSKR